MRIRTVPTALLLSAVGVAAVLLAPSAGSAPGNPTCAVPPSTNTGFDTPVNPLAGPFYPGPAASSTYDSQWRGAFPIPHLPDYVPQGMTTWRNWNDEGEGEALVLIGLYRGEKPTAEPSIIAAMDPASGEQYGAVTVRAAHLGGIAVVGNFLFTQDSPTKTRENVRRYRLSSLREALIKSHESGARPFVGRLAEMQRIHGADFMTVHDGKLWSGRYSEHENGRMYEYSADPQGNLRTTGAAWPIPPRTQGALVTDTAFVFNSSNHNQPGVMVITERSRAADRATVCFRAPSMGEGLTLVDDRVLNLFEGGSYKYPKAVNRITGLHEGSMESLGGLLRDQV